MSSFLSPPHPHNLSPVRIRELRGRTAAAQAGGQGRGAGSTGSTRGAQREVGRMPREREKGVSALGTGLSTPGWLSRKPRHA